MILARYTATVEAAPGEPDYRGRAQILNAASDYTATVANAAAQAILVQPRLALSAPGDTIPLVSGRIRWLHNGADPATGEPVGPVKITADLLGCSREWNWPLAASRGSLRGGDFVKNPLGYEIDRGGPVPGRSVKIDLELDLYDYETPATLTARLINGGAVRESDRVANAEEHVLEPSGAGYADRYARRRIDLKLPADHGLTHGEIAIVACGLAGVPAEEILIDPDLGAPRTRALALACVPLWQVLKDVLSPIGYRPNDSREPRGIAAFPVFVDAGSVVATINRSDVDASAGVSFKADATVETCVRVTGTDPTARAVPAAGTVTIETKAETFETDRPFRYGTAVQDGAGAITALAGSGDYVKPGETLVKRATVRQTYEDGCLVRTRATVEGWRLIEHYRYVLSASADGTPHSYPVCFFFDGVPVKDDAADAYRLPYELFLVLHESIEDIGRDAQGRELNVTRKTVDWGWPEAAVKDRASTAVAWEDALYIAGAKTQGSGTGRRFDHETQFLGPQRPDGASEPGSGNVAPRPGILNPVTRKYLEQAELERFANACNEETGTLEEFYRLGLRPGLTRLYADGTESSEAVETGRLDETTKVTRLSTGPTSRTEITSGTAPKDGRASAIKPKNTVVQTGLVGALPNIPICLPEERTDDGTEFSVTVCLERVLDDPEADPLTEEGSIKDLSSPFVESEDEARFWAALELELGAGIRGTIALAYTSPALDIGKTIVVDLPEWGYAAEPAIVESVETTVGDGRLVDVLVVRFPLFV